MSARTCRRLGLVGGLLLLMLAGLRPLAAQQPQAARVEVAQVRQKTIAQPVTFVGTVGPEHQSLVASEVEGIVERVAVEEGQFVQQGAMLVQLRQESLQLVLQTRQSTAERYRQELLELKNGTRPEELAEAKAAVSEAEALVAQARRDTTRQLGLSERGIAALQSHEDAETALEVAQQSRAGARQRYALLVRGTRTERIAQAEAQYEVARAEVARLQYDLRHTRVEAPFNGFIVAKHTEVGQWLERGATVVTIIDLSQAHITVPVPERYMPHLQRGDSALVQFDALPDTTWQGTLIRVIPQATESRTFPVTVEVDNAQAQIKSGFFARVTLMVGEQHHALLVPKDAIVTQGPRQLVYAVRDGKATPVPVQRTSFHEGFAVITGEVQPGETVVVRGNERLRPEQPVQVQQDGAGG